MSRRRPETGNEGLDQTADRGGLVLASHPHTRTDTGTVGSSVVNECTTPHSLPHFFHTFDVYTRVRNNG